MLAGYRRGDALDKRRNLMGCLGYLLRAEKPLLNVKRLAAIEAMIAARVWPGESLENYQMLRLAVFAEIAEIHHRGHRTRLSKAVFATSGLRGEQSIANPISCEAYFRSNDVRERRRYVSCNRCFSRLFCYSYRPLAPARSPCPNRLSQIEKIVERCAADSPRTAAGPTSGSGAS